jgi:hypothetical protein
MANDPAAIAALRLTIRARALANLMLVLGAESRRSGGRISVRALERDALVLQLRDVRTLVRCRDGFEIAPRDFTIMLACPPLWPFERQSALQPFVIAPADFAGPNTDGRAFCLDLAGIPPERLVHVLYDNVRLRQFRLDHCVDRDAAAFVRSRLSSFPTDDRPLHVATEDD